MYQYSYYLTNSYHPIIKYPSIENKEIQLLSMVYNNINWEKDELVDFGHDLYIICSNTRNSHDLYSPDNGFMYYTSESKFGKCFYTKIGSKNTTRDDFVWTIFNDPETEHDLLYHKKTKRFLALGINYQDGNNFNLQIPNSNLNLDNNKETRNPILYYIEQSTLVKLKKSGKVKDRTNYNEMYADCCWSIEKYQDNKYSITHAISGKILWFSSNQFQLSNSKDLTSGTNKNIPYPTINKIGYISFSNSNTEDEEQEYAFCDNLGDENCYNRYFYIVPTQPVNITGDCIISDEITKKNLFKTCPNSQGKNPLNKDKWYSQISQQFQTPYGDQGTSDNPYKNIFKLYGKEGNYNNGVLDLAGGGGANCSKSNFCHVEKKLMPQDITDRTVNPVSLSKLETNKQTLSQNISTTVKDIFGKESIKHNYPAPLNKYNYQCVRNQFNIYKIFGNVTTKSFDTNRNQNLNTSQDDPYRVNDQDREVALSIYSTNKNEIEGKHFGMSPDGQYVWFMTSYKNQRGRINYLNEGNLRIIKKNLIELQNNYLTLSNMTQPQVSKRKRQKIVTWDDMIKFQNIGYNVFSKFKVYAYNNARSSLNINNLT